MALESFFAVTAISGTAGVCEDRFKLLADFFAFGDGTGGATGAGLAANKLDADAECRISDETVTNKQRNWLSCASNHLAFLCPG